MLKAPIGFASRCGVLFIRLRRVATEFLAEENPLLHVWDLYDTALCLRVLWILHHRHVQFFLAFEGDVCCAIISWRSQIRVEACPQEISSKSYRQTIGQHKCSAYCRSSCYQVQ